MQDFDPLTLTEEQLQEVKKVISQAKRAMLFIGLKFAAGIFFTNIACILFIVFFMADLQLETLKNFQFACMIINFLFMSSFLTRQIRANDAIVNDKIKEILKKNVEKDQNEFTDLE